MPRAGTLCLSAFLTLALCACASIGEYPSLAPREAERITGTAEPVTPQAPPPEISAPPSAELETRLASLVEQAKAAHERFHENRARAERLIAAADGSEIASERWSVASIALAELESARSSTMVALSDLDGLYAAERVDHFQAESNTAKAIASARRAVMPLVVEQDDILTHLRARLAG